MHSTSALHHNQQSAMRATSVARVHLLRLCVLSLRTVGRLYETFYVRSCSNCFAVTSTYVVLCKKQNNYFDVIRSLTNVGTVVIQCMPSGCIERNIVVLFHVV